MKAEFEKLGINKLFNAPSGFNNLKAKVDDLDAGKLKTVPIDLNELSGVVSYKVVKKTIQQTFLVCQDVFMMSPA